MDSLGVNYTEPIETADVLKAKKYGKGSMDRQCTL